jgi:hypothetical protein
MHVAQSPYIPLPLFLGMDTHTPTHTTINTIHIHTCGAVAEPLFPISLLTAGWPAWFMYVCIYIYIYIYIYICMCICMFPAWPDRFTCMYVCMYTCIQTCMFVAIHTSLWRVDSRLSCGSCVCIHVYMYVQLHIGMVYSCLHISSEGCGWCTHVYMYVCIIVCRRVWFMQVSAPLPTACGPVGMTSACMYVCTCVRISTDIYTFIDTWNISVLRCASLHGSRIHTCMHAYIRTCIHSRNDSVPCYIEVAYIHTYMHAYVHTYIPEMTLCLATSKSRMSVVAILCSWAVSSSTWLLCIYVCMYVCVFVCGCHFVQLSRELVNLIVMYVCMYVWLCVYMWLPFCADEP